MQLKSLTFIALLLRAALHVSLLVSCSDQEGSITQNSRNFEANQSGVAAQDVHVESNPTTATIGGSSSNPTDKPADKIVDKNVQAQNSEQELPASFQNASKTVTSPSESSLQVQQVQLPLEISGNLKVLRSRDRAMGSSFYVGDILELRGEVTGASRCRLYLNSIAATSPYKEKSRLSPLYQIEVTFDKIKMEAAAKVLFILECRSNEAVVSKSLSIDILPVTISSKPFATEAAIIPTGEIVQTPPTTDAPDTNTEQNRSLSPIQPVSFGADPESLLDTVMGDISPTIFLKFDDLSDQKSVASGEMVTFVANWTQLDQCMLNRLPVNQNSFPLVTTVTATRDYELSCTDNFGNVYSTSVKLEIMAVASSPGSDPKPIPTPKETKDVPRDTSPYTQIAVPFDLIACQAPLTKIDFSKGLQESMWSTASTEDLGFVGVTTATFDIADELEKTEFDDTPKASIMITSVSELAAPNSRLQIGKAHDHELMVTSEATLTIALPEVRTGLVLSFQMESSQPSNTSLMNSLYLGQSTGTGVLASLDGNTWYPLLFGVRDFNDVLAVSIDRWLAYWELDQNLLLSKSKLYIKFQQTSGAVGEGEYSGIFVDNIMFAPCDI